MEPNALLARLRQLLAEPPSPRGWETLGALLCAPMGATTKHVALEYAEAHLERWPDALRAANVGTNAPTPAGLWVLRALRGEPAPELRLARSVGVHGLALAEDALARLGRALEAAAPTALALDGCRLPAQPLADLLDAPAWARLERLSVAACGLRGAALAGLQRAPFAPRLARLDASDNAFDPGDLAALGDALADGALPALRALLLAHCGLSDRALARLCDQGALERVDHLDLAHNPLAGAHDGLGRLLAFGDLGHLDLRACGLTFSALARLKRAPQRARLDTLNIGHNALGARGLRALVALPALRAVAALDVASCDLHDDALAALLDAPCLAQLRRLNVSSNRVSPDALAALVRAPLHALHTLGLAHTGFADAHDRALEGCPAPPALRRLDLSRSSSGVGPPGCARIDGVAQLAPALETLDLSGHPLGPAALRSLLAAPWTDTLRELDLSGAQAGDALRSLTDAPWPALTALRLDNTAPSDATVKALIDGLHAPNLTELTLNLNPLSPDAHAALAASPRLARLERLELSDTRLNDAALRAYRHAPALRLRVLTLNRNRFRALDPLTSNPHLRALDRLEINWNNVNDAQLFAVFTAPHLSLTARARLLDQAATSTLAAFARHLHLPIAAAHNPAQASPRARHIPYEPGGPGTSGLTQEELMEILDTSGLLDRTPSDPSGAEAPRFDLPIGIALARADDPDPLRSVFDEPDEPGPDARAALLEAIGIALAQQAALDALNPDAPPPPPP